jgi:apolipoprotein N-acyltransferase
MVLNFFHLLKNLSLVLLSSLLLVLSFPRFDLGILVWVGLLPLFIAINGKRLRDSFLLSLLINLSHWIALHIDYLPLDFFILP